MIPLIIALTISIFLVIFYIVFTMKYRAHIQKLDLFEKEEKKLSHLIKYVSEEKKELMKQKLEKISQIIKETEVAIERAVTNKFISLESQKTQIFDEEGLIDEAGKDYNIYMSGLTSAMPKTKADLIQDIANLEEAIKKLESYDKSYYESESKDINVGVGIFHEKMSRKFNSIIQEHNLDEFPIIPIQWLKYHAYTEIKGIKESDFLPIIRLMKTTGFITNLIEINTNLYILVFLEDFPKLSNAEKVVLSFAYDKEILTMQDLLELTEWDFTYADKIINKLIRKELVLIENESIIVKGFRTFSDRENWDSFINLEISKEKEREDAKLKRQLELKSKLKSSLEHVKEIKQQLVELKQNIIVSEESDNIEEEAPKKKFEGKPKVKALPHAKSIESKKKKSNLKLPLDFENIQKEDLNLKEIISQKVLDFHEKFSVVNGGFCQYEKVREFVYQELESISEGDLKSVLNSLIELKLISKSIKIGKSNFYLFKNLELSAKEKSFIRFALNKSPLKKAGFKKGLKWKEEDVLIIMKHLQEKRILRIESDKIIIPGIIQKI